MDDAWLLFPLCILVMLAGSHPLSPVPLLMMLAMTNTLTRLLPNPLPLLDYPIIELNPRFTTPPTLSQLNSPTDTNPSSPNTAADTAGAESSESPASRLFPRDMPAALREKRRTLQALARERVGVPSLRRTVDAVLPPSWFPGVRGALGVAVLGVT